MAEFNLHDESKLLPALCAAQAELLPIVKNRENAFTESKYLDLSELLRVTKPVLSSHKLVVIQTVDSTQRGTGETDTRITVATRLYHVESGEYVVCGGTLGITALHKANPTQKLFATGSYMRRNQLLAVLCLAGADDDTDGNVGEEEAIERQNHKPRRETPAQPEPEHDEAREAKLDELRKIVTQNCFSDRDRAEFRKLVSGINTTADLDIIIEDAKTAFTLKQRKAAATGPEDGNLI